MKLNIRIQILLCNIYVLLLCIAIVFIVPLQFAVFLFKGKKKVVRPLEDKVLQLNAEMQPIYDAMAILRSVMVLECIHP